MKKSISILLAFVICMVPVLLLSSCQKGDASAAEFKGITDDVGIKFGQLDEADMEAFAVTGSDNKDDNVLYNNAEVEMGFVIDKDTKSTAHTRYLVTDAIYKDVDGDGKDEVYTMGVTHKNGKLTVDYFDYGEYPYDDETKMHKLGSAYFDATLSLGFVDDNDGSVHLVQYTDAEKKTVKEDWGAISLNGSVLEVSKNAISAPTDTPDMSIFRDISNDTYTFNGKEYKPAADFAYNPENVLDVYYSCDEIEKVTGQKPKSLGAEMDGMALITVYGKKYVHFMSFEDYYDNLVGEYVDGFEYMSLATKDYAAKTATTTAAQ